MFRENTLLAVCSPIFYGLILREQSGPFLKIILHLLAFDELGIAEARV